MSNVVLCVIDADRWTEEEKRFSEGKTRTLPPVFWWWNKARPAGIRKKIYYHAFSELSFES